MEAAALAAALLLTWPCSLAADGQRDGQWGDRLYGREEGAPPVAAIEDVDAFADAGLWRAWADSGEAITTLRSATRVFADSGGRTQQALGLKVEFLSAKASRVYMFAERPIALESRCAMLSLDVLGRSFSHRLSLIVLDYYGRSRELALGELNFSGWRRLYAYLPPAGEAAGIMQDDLHYERPAGIRVAGLVLDCEQSESYGSYYVYFDALQATIEGSGGVSGLSAVRAGGIESSAAAAAPPGDAIAAASGGSSPASAVDADEAGRLMLAELSKRIRDGLVYPAAARRRGLEGTAIVAFVVGGSGALESASVERSSDSDILDRAALDLLKSVFPVENEAHSRLSLRIAIGYRLSDGAAKP
jgi:TonB family C-terminal domain